MKHITFTILCILSSLVLISCSFIANEKNDSSKFTVATWNVQNIFNAEDEGNEYDEFRQSSGWDERAYKNRLNNLAIVFSYLDADVLVLNEVENEKVVEDIISTVKDYPYCCTAKEVNGAISIAIISRYPITNCCAHSVIGTRPILQADINADNKTVKIFAVHGKSKLDSEETSAALRLELGKTLDMVAHPDADELIIAAGDFNESVEENNIFCDIRYNLTQAPLKVSPVPDENYWYNPFLDSSQTYNADGTYCYHDKWSFIDNIICRNTQNWVISDSKIITKGILTTADGKPNAFNRALLTGVSDHYPVTLSFQFLP